MAWRLVLARRAGDPARAGARGVHPDADRARRALASAVPRHRHGHPCHRRRQRDRLGGARRRRAGRPLLWRQRDHRRRRPHEGPAGACGLSRCLRARGRRQLRLDGGDRRQPRRDRGGYRRRDQAPPRPDRRERRFGDALHQHVRHPQEPARALSLGRTAHHAAPGAHPDRADPARERRLGRAAADLYPLRRLGGAGTVQDPRRTVPGRSHLALPRACRPATTRW